MVIKALLFADAVGYSKLTEKQVLGFIRHFLGKIAVRLTTFPFKPAYAKTQGDGLYMVFADVRQAGLVALEISDLVNQTKWSDYGLPETLNLRTALHVGPVYPITEPITGERDYTGSNVSRAARIEPITPPGLVYASQAFAALTIAQNVTEFTCEYVGQTPLAKGYGSFPTYHVRRDLSQRERRARS
jgi:class 3 adenylate cyclase